MPAPFRYLLLLGLLALSAPQVAHAAGDAPHFLGKLSCSSSGCHGGGEGRGQFVTYEKRDIHQQVAFTLASGRSKQMGTKIGIPDVRVDSRCTACHSPLMSVAENRLHPDITLQEKTGVSCETCHGPASDYIRYHTRMDISHAQRVAGGLRETKDLYHRANVCIACHLYLGPDVAKTDHKEIIFELATQMRKEPPHWVEDDDDPYIEARAWVVGQAAALRELAYRQGKSPDPQLAARIDALTWVLQLSSAGASATAESADRLAKSASGKKWGRDSTLAQLKKFSGLSSQFRGGGANAETQRRRAQLLLRAMNAFFVAFEPKTEAEAIKADPTGVNRVKVVAGDRTIFTNANYDALQKRATYLVDSPGGFSAAEFGNILDQMDVEVGKLK